MLTHSASLYASSVLIWGSTWYAIKFQLGLVAAEVSLVYRFALAAAILLLFCVASRRNLRYSPREHGYIALQGLFLFSSNYLVFYWATGLLTSGIVALMFSTVILMNIINGAIFMRIGVSHRVLAGAGFGKFMIKYFNFFAKKVLKMATGDKSRLTKEIHRHYIIPLAGMKERKGTWVFPRQIIHSSQWLDELWSKRARIKDKPALMLWGMKDIAFRENELKQWEKLFSKSKTVRFEDAGHMVQEEKGKEVVPIIDEFLIDHK